VANQLLGDRTDQDLSGGGRLLQPFRGVDGVAGSEGCSLVARDHLAGVDPDPDPQLGHLVLGE